MSDSTTERVLELQKRLAIRLAELGFTGTPAENIVHRLAEIAVLAKHLTDESVPLLLEMSPVHTDAMISLMAHIKWDMDEIRDTMHDLEPDLVELIEFLKQRSTGDGRQ